MAVAPEGPARRPHPAKMDGIETCAPPGHLGLYGVDRDRAAFPDAEAAIPRVRETSCLAYLPHHAARHGRPEPPEDWAFPKASRTCRATPAAPGKRTTWMSPPASSASDSLLQIEPRRHISDPRSSVPIRGASALSVGGRVVASLKARLASKRLPRWTRSGAPRAGRRGRSQGCREAGKRGAFAWRAPPSHSSPSASGGQSARRRRARGCRVPRAR
jgi:hypothetical protein